MTSDSDAFLDLALEVLSIANELMLDRLAQCCQKVLGQYGESTDIIFGRIVADDFS